MDCFVAALLAMTAVGTCTQIPIQISKSLKRQRAAFPRRDASEFCYRPSLKKIRGRREVPGARCTRDLVCKVHIESGTRAYRFSGNTRHSLRNGFGGLFRALVSAKSARMCERAVLTNRPSLDLIPFVLKGQEPVGERGTDPVSSSTRTVAWASSPDRARKGVDDGTKRSSCRRY